MDVKLRIRLVKVGAAADHEFPIPPLVVGDLCSRRMVFSDGFK